MAGNRTGGLKAAAKIKSRDKDFFKKIGAKGGKNGNTGGFYNNSDLARAAGLSGGRGNKKNG